MYKSRKAGVFFSFYEKKNPFNNIQVAKTTFKKTHVYNKEDKK